MSVGSAVIDATGRYRYVLYRQWHESRRIPHGSALGCDKGVVLWIMLNPSTADATADDPTIRRCIGFSRAWGFDGLAVVNLFAHRATDPRELELVGFPYDSRPMIGPDNDETILREVTRANLVVAAWGNRGVMWARAEQVREMIGPGVLNHIGLTKMGQPRHPLYVRGDMQPQPWRLGDVSGTDPK